MRLTIEHHLKWKSEQNINYINVYICDIKFPNNNTNRGRSWSCSLTPAQWWWWSQLRTIITKFPACSSRATLIAWDEAEWRWSQHNIEFKNVVFHLECGILNQFDTFLHLQLLLRCSLLPPPEDHLSWLATTRRSTFYCHRLISINIFIACYMYCCHLFWTIQW